MHLHYPALPRGKWDTSSFFLQHEENTIRTIPQAHKKSSARSSIEENFQWLSEEIFKFLCRHSCNPPLYLAKSCSDTVTFLRQKGSLRLWDIWIANYLDSGILSLLSLRWKRNKNDALCGRSVDARRTVSIFRWRLRGQVFLLPEEPQLSCQRLGHLWCRLYVRSMH